MPRAATKSARYPELVNWRVPRRARGRSSASPTEFSKSEDGSSSEAGVELDHGAAERSRGGNAVSSRTQTGAVDTAALLSSHVRPVDKWDDPRCRGFPLFDGSGSKWPAIG